MEILRTLILIENLVLGLFLCLAAGYFYLQSRRITDPRVFGLLALVFYFCMPGILGAFSPTLLRIVVPLAPVPVLEQLSIALPLMIACVFIGVFIRFGRPGRKNPQREWKLARQLTCRYWPGRLFLVSFAFFCMGLIGIYVELHHAGGWLSVLQRGGSAYMKARVTQSVGFFGVLVTFIPISAIGMMCSTVLSRAVPRGLRWPIVLAILCSAVGLISLLTVRNASMMLLLSIVALLEIRSGKLFRMIAPALLLLFVLGAYALASIRYSSRTQNIDQFAGNIQHIEISERIIATFRMQDYIWGGNIPNLFEVFIPRAIWPNKPMGFSIIRAAFPEFAKEGGVKTAGLFGEGYASGGLFMVAVEGIIFGIMLRRMRGFWDRRQANSFQFMAYGSILLGYIYVTAQAGFVTQSDMTFFAMLAQLWITNRLCSSQPRSTHSRVPTTIRVSEPAAV